MRVVQLYVPRGERSSILATLESEAVEYGLTEETSDSAFEAIVSVPVPVDGVDSLLSRLHADGLHDDVRIVVMGVEASVSGDPDADRSRYAPTQLSRAEIRAQAISLAPAASTFFALLVLSSIIATAGLLTDSTATIIGAMVVAPLMGPALAASVGVVVHDESLASRGIALQAGGLFVTVLTAALVGWALRGTVLLPPGLDITTIPAVEERITPTLLSLFLALGSGAAAVVSLTRDVGSVLVGVAIAVALVPPAATAGLGIAWWHPTVVLTAGTLVLVNLLAINLTALVMLWLLGYRPYEVERVDRAVSRLRARVAIFIVAIAVLTVILAVVTYGTYQVAALTHDVDRELAAMSDDPAFEEVTFHEVAVEYEVHDVVADRPAAVTVLVERPPGEAEPPDFAERVRTRLAAVVDAELDVTVELIDTQRSRPERTAAPTSNPIRVTRIDATPLRGGVRPQ
ncbi:TIGR00341 family protein [Halovivax limisalsi]|uniref:TIGR00341 family protein n=1 Tax=Halovivax limisalsi TaxID=1453760 RepID=UPI001FFC49FD|nr:TIGR00341 family protein [Halovivax limisalsi]